MIALGELLLAKKRMRTGSRAIEDILECSLHRFGLRLARVSPSCSPGLRRSCDDQILDLVT